MLRSIDIKMARKAVSTASSIRSKTHTDQDRPNNHSNTDHSAGGIVNLTAVDVKGPASTAEPSSSLAAVGPSRHPKALIVTPEGCSLDPSVFPTGLKAGGLG